MLSHLRDGGLITVKSGGRGMQRLPLQARAGTRPGTAAVPGVSLSR
jgi:hypothetical protein